MEHLREEKKTKKNTHILIILNLRDKKYFIITF